MKHDKNGVMYLNVDEQKEVVQVMSALGKKYPELTGYYPQPKGLLNHGILSVQSLSGIYSPFTVEANYNTGMTDYNIPFTACHELSHLRGFMQEEEANFIAFLACLESDIADFRYSGYLLGWINSMNLLYRVDYDAWETIRAMLSEAVEPDLKENGHADGVASYDRMSDLIVIYHCKNRK